MNLSLDHIQNAKDQTMRVLSQCRKRTDLAKDERIERARQARDTVRATAHAVFNAVEANALAAQQNVYAAEHAARDAITVTFAAYRSLVEYLASDDGQD